MTHVDTDNATVSPRGIPRKARPRILNYELRVCIPPSWAEQLDAIAASEQTDRSEIVRRLLRAAGLGKHNGANHV